MEKYLQDTEQHRALEVNYFDDNTTGQNAKSSPEDIEQTSTANICVTKNLLESLKADTGHAPRQHLAACTSAEEKCQQPKTSKEDIKQDVEHDIQQKILLTKLSSLSQTDYIHCLLLLMKSECQLRR